MDAKLKDLWLKALRSGEYEQGRVYLRSNIDGKGDRFCCLGVLCDVAAKNGFSDPDVELSEDKHTGVFQVNGDNSLPTGAFGLDRETLMGAWHRNDGYWGQVKHSFSQIADWLETAVSTDAKE